MKRKIYHDLYHSTEYLQAALKETDTAVIKTQVKLALNMLHAAFKRETEIRRKNDKRNKGDHRDLDSPCDHNMACKK